MTEIGTASVTQNGSYTSSGGLPTPLPGEYWLYASYSGDENNSGADSPCSPTALQEVTVSAGTVSLSSVTVTTTVVEVANGVPTDIPWTGTDVTGADASDTASVTPFIDGGPTPTGTVTFYLLSGGCSGSSVEVYPDDTMTNGTADAWGSVDNLAAGTYGFVASYSGDSVYAPEQGVCELFTVNPATPKLTTTVDDVTSGTAWSGTEPANSLAQDSSSLSNYFSCPVGRSRTRSSLAVPAREHRSRRRRSCR
jgi:hypothetical protein